MGGSWAKHVELDVAMQVLFVTKFKERIQGAIMLHLTLHHIFTVQSEFLLQDKFQI
jgi:hypothetical protein